MTAVPTTTAVTAPAGLSYERVACPDRTATVLLQAAARVTAGRDCADLTRAPTLRRYHGAPERIRRQAVARAGCRLAIPAGQAYAIDAERIAQQIVGHYPASAYSGALIGSPHGAALHLAAALGMPWLPDGFETSVRWPHGAVDDPTGALIHGMPVAASLIASNPDVAVRQVHDPCAVGAVAGSTITLVAHWRRLPKAYRAFLAHRLAPCAPVLLIGDARPWPAFDAGGGHTFQVGSPGNGLAAEEYLHPDRTLCHVLRHTGGDPRRWQPPQPSPATLPAQYAVEADLTQDLAHHTTGRGAQLHQVWYDDPHALSAATADVYQLWLRAAGKTGNRVVVECDTLLDPWQVIRAGLVPYWCEAAVPTAADSARQWLARSTGCTSVDVLPQPPGRQHPAVAATHQWQHIARYGNRRGVVDPSALRRYPHHPLPARHATRVLRGQPYDLPRPPRLPLPSALDSLQGSAGSGLLVR